MVSAKVLRETSLYKAFDMTTHSFQYYYRDF